MINKKPSDKFFEDHVLTELLVDLIEYGITINPYKQPIAETWIAYWRDDFRFQNFIINKQCKNKPGRLVLIEMLKETEEVKKGFHMIVRKRRKKLHYKL